MTAYGAEVRDTECFRRHFDSLCTKYPQDALAFALEQFKDFLRLGYSPPQMLADPTIPQIYVMRMDYPAAGAAGRGRFLVIYHATDLKPLSMFEPFRVYTLISISERNP